MQEWEKENKLGGGGEPCGGLQLRLQLAGPWLAQLEDGLRAAPIAWHYTDSNPHSVPKYCRLGGILFITIALVQWTIFLNQKPLRNKKNRNLTFAFSNNSQLVQELFSVLYFFYVCTVCFMSDKTSIIVGCFISKWEMKVKRKHFLMKEKWRTLGNFPLKWEMEATLKGMISRSY